MSKLINKTLLLSDIDNMIKNTKEKIKTLIKENDIKWNKKYLKTEFSDNWFDGQILDEDNYSCYSFEKGKLYGLKELKERL